MKNWNYLLIALFLVVIAFFYFKANEPIPSYRDDSSIDPYQDPIQVNGEYEPIIIKFRAGVFEITPVAEYKIAARVASKHSYYFGWSAKLSPIDLALTWGELADAKYDKFIKYSQFNRYYIFQYNANSPLDKAYIQTHSSNHHIIPATTNVRNAIRKIKRKEIVFLEGYLVNIKGHYKGGEYWWNTSLTRQDSGGGACELFYVTKVKMRNYVYE